MNSSDQAGSVMAALVWLLMLYSSVTVTLLTITEGVPPILGMLYMFLVTMALSAHAKTSLTDPGSVPKNAVPVESQRRDLASHSMCGQCSTFKPPMSHHCRICNRCVSRMDHHCPWMNNCVGAANFSTFVYSVVTFFFKNLKFGMCFRLTISITFPTYLYQTKKIRTFYIISFVYMDLCGLFTIIIWLELFLLCR